MFAVCEHVHLGKPVLVDDLKYAIEVSGYFSYNIIQ